MDNKLNEIAQKKVSRRSFLKASGVGAAAAVAVGVSGNMSFAGDNLSDKKLAMVIDLQKCTGCGGCILACKNENNVQDGVAWASRITKTYGVFPNVRFQYVPTLCNHCENAPCVENCPTKAMHKGDGNITMHDPGKCIGCKICMSKCPYDVIHYNEAAPQEFWADTSELIAGCTATAASTVTKVDGTGLPYYNPDRELTKAGTGLRYKGVVEKCTLCEHRVRRTPGELPYCVERCPSNARIFGDLDDDNSEVNQILGKYEGRRLKEHLGTKPKVIYVRSFNNQAHVSTKGSI
ncbi:MAG: 4Fe-4S dicluster domain-containing protein [Chloroflexi bacterium]|jgi:Fe-S-cluster-containing dehydrogenase component|nr:4Fe-4S dicluster domain-containing protein [Chloroflexota bacterium]MBT7082572.1 4Fe-4S dicluster domain-containing protein [Chloroflexota bacterium]MBT7289117.1 4Fe-4S dicluster domain-containing protein [Chloroflexota bacterium]